jgi:SpoVK/Ycf46/Vps4 family AAA+-type ATPase
MYELPHLFVSKETLVPHPGTDYTISIPLSVDLSTKNLIIEDVEYKNLFVCIIEDVNTSLCSLCLLQNVSYTQDEQIIYFTSLNKMKFHKKKKKTTLVTFVDEKPLTKVNKEYLMNLLTFIKQSNDLNFISNFITSETDPENLFSCLAALLYLPTASSVKIYTLSDFKSKINILYNAVINTVIMISNNLELDGSLQEFPDSVNHKITHEENRLSNISPSSPEYSSTLDYLEILKNIPWNKYKTFEKDISFAQIKLNNIHYGLDKVKDEFLDFIYLEKLTQVKTSSCFLFDGPPGVGKTSLAKSIAKALNRDFIFISLAGASDEAEIRGHRRTYTGSKPGRIASSLKSIESMNPIILLDEIDKIASINGVKAIESSLLELFDSEQREKFLDRYLEVPLDLSKAIFICTSNNIENISKPLLDRLQLITFENYTTEEKTHIIDEYIFPKIINEYSLNIYNLKLDLSFKKYLAENCTLRDVSLLLSRCLRRKAKYFLSNKSESNLLNLDFASPFLIPATKTRRIGFC